MDRKVWLKSQSARALNLKLILCYCTSILGVKKQQQLRKKKKQEMKEERKKERKKEATLVLLQKLKSLKARGPGVDQVW